MESSEATMEAALKLLQKAWTQRDAEISGEQKARIKQLEREVGKLRSELDSSLSYIEELKEKNEELVIVLQQKQSQSVRIQQLRETLVSALDEDFPVETKYIPKMKTKRQEIRTEVTSPTNPNRQINGKYFFAETRKRLSFDQFNQFLSYVKKLNDKTISRSQAIRDVKDIFGDEAQDLYEDFISLISKT